MQASFYTKENDKVRCLLCPHHCLINDGHLGICRVRRNDGGRLVAETYGEIAAIYLDPIEKKPLYHFYPGSNILSIGSVGCNMQCTFCQNCDISQVGIREYGWLKKYTVDQLINEVRSIKGNLGIAFTYNEPTVFFEYMLDVAKEPNSLGYKNVMITNGYIEEEPLLKLLPFIDAFNVDLKAFTEDFYHKQTRSHLEPVKQTLLHLQKAQKHTEITNLIIPGLNDSVREFSSMVDWICNELGRSTVLHLSRYFPRHQLTRPATPDSTLLHFFEIAQLKLDYVYIGNVGNQLQGHDTICAKCKSVVIRRSGYNVDASGINTNGACNKCGCPVVVNA